MAPAARTGSAAASSAARASAAGGVFTVMAACYKAQISEAGEKMKAASVLDYRELARRRLPRFLFDYIDGGSYAEVTLRGNVAELERIALRQRVLRDVSAIDLKTTL